MLQRQMSAAAIFEAARNMHLPTVADALGFKFKRGVEKFFGNTCPNCGEGPEHGNAVSIFEDNKATWRWHCFCCSEGGTSIDFVASCMNLEHFPAAKLLVEKRLAPVVCSERVAVRVEESAEAVNARLECFKLIHQKGGREDKQISAYFESRSIRSDTIERAVARDLIRMLPTDPKVCVAWLQENVGESRLRAAGLWRAKWPAIAFRPIVSFLPGMSSVEFRIAREVQSPEEPKSIRYGAMKWPWWWRSRSSSPITKVLVVEGIVDMLSVIQMRAEDHAHIMAIPGTGTWNSTWIKQVAEKNSDCTTCVIGVDRGNAGDELAKVMEKEIMEKGFDAYRILPTKDDWNIDLVGGRTSVF